MPLRKDLASLQAGANEAAASIDKQREAAMADRYKQGDEQRKNKQSIDTLKKLLGVSDDSDLADALQQRGGQFKVGDVSGGVDPHIKADQNNMKGGAQALQHATDMYNKSLPKIQGAAQAASEGLDLVNDPRNIGSLGQARTLMLKAMGMNRYNEQEAKAVLPPSLQGMVAGIFNQAGGDETPMNDSQRRSVNQFFSGALSTAKQQHDMLKQNTMQAYQTSPYFDSSRGQMLQQTLGAPVDKMLGEGLSKVAQLPTTQTAPSQRPEPQGITDKLGSWLKGGISSMMGNSPAAPAAPTQPQALPAQNPLQQPSQAQGASAPTNNNHKKGPVPGYIEDGHRFKGGNPADQNSWEPITPMPGTQ